MPLDATARHTQRIRARLAYEGGAMQDCRDRCAADDDDGDFAAEPGWQPYYRYREACTTQAGRLISSIET